VPASTSSESEPRRPAGGRERPGYFIGDAGSSTISGPDDITGLVGYRPNT